MTAPAATGLDAIAGRAYGPFRSSASPAKIAEFVAATADDESRWVDHAPPGWAAGLLFAAAPRFFADPDVVPHAGALIHSEQRFGWRGSIAIGEQLDVVGVVAGVRSRSSMHLVSFDLEATPPGAGEPLVTSHSTFLMSPAAAYGSDVEDEAEPPVDDRAINSPLQPSDLPAVGETLPPLLRSASRADLVRYAAATLDFNPIHWDHASAVSAGLPGVVAHGLLMGAWAAQAAARVGRAGPDPLAEMRLRFRRPLRPAAQAEIGAIVRSVEPGFARLKLSIGSDGVDLVSGEAVVNREAA